jgi:hypothetical protein
VLHIGFIRGLVAARNDGQARNAFPSNKPDLHASFFGPIGDDGGEALLDKIDAVDRSIAKFNRHPKRQIDGSR